MATRRNGCRATLMTKLPGVIHGGEALKPQVMVVGVIWEGASAAATIAVGKRDVSPGIRNCSANGARLGRLVDPDRPGLLRAAAQDELRIVYARHHLGGLKKSAMRPKSIVATPPATATGTGYHGESLQIVLSFGQGQSDRTDIAANSD
jgi:hypothetical protein